MLKCFDYFNKFSSSYFYNLIEKFYNTLTNLIKLQIFVKFVNISEKIAKTLENL